MRTDKQIRDAVRCGQCRAVDAQLEVLLDIREKLGGLAELSRQVADLRRELTALKAGIGTSRVVHSGLMSQMITHLEMLSSRWRKPGRARKKQDGPQPAR